MVEPVINAVLELLFSHTSHGADVFAKGIK